MKIIKSLIIIITIGAIAWLYGMQPKEATDNSITILTSDNQNISINSSIAQKIPFITKTLKNKKDSESIQIGYPKSTFESIITVLHALEADPSFKRADGIYVPQKIQPIINAALQQNSIEDVAMFIEASDFLLLLNKITQSAIRVWLEKTLQENQTVSLEEISEGLASKFKSFIAQQYILIKNNLPEFSIADYIALHGQPQIANGAMNLSNKKLTSLDGIDLIENSSKIKKLYLVNNIFYSLDPEIFKNFANLETLDLANNNLYEVSRAAFEGLSMLQNLSLHTNHIQSIEPGTFQRVPLLKKLSLKDNPLIQTETQIRRENKLGKNVTILI